MKDSKIDRRFSSGMMKAGDGEKRLTEILMATKLGLWIIEIDTNKDEYRMFVDESMSDILGVKGEALSPEEYYWHWYDHINDGYYSYVNMAVREMMNSGEIIELEYTWNHPTRGEVPVRCVGVLEKQEQGVYTLRGYHRINGDMVKKSFLKYPGQEMFEYNEKKQTIYYHTDRFLIKGEQKKENNFPVCWLEQGMVHPYFAESFRELLTSVKEKKDKQVLDLMLKNKKDEFEWFRMKTEHLSSEAQDVNTLIVSLSSMTEDQTIHLQYLRKNDFYQSLLTETAAYLEVDLEENLINSGGGLWKNYVKESLSGEYTYQKIVDSHAREKVLAEDYQGYYDHLCAENMRQAYQSGRETQHYQFCRKDDDGRYRWMELVIHVFQEHITEKMYALIYLRDIDASKRRDLEQERAATIDPLTDVLNRFTFQQKVTGYMENNRDARGILMMLDMDYFKEVNDTWGHQAGDSILKAFAEVLKKYFASTGYVGRLGGDEFSVFISQCPLQEVLEQKMDRLMRELEEISPLSVSVSAGIEEAEADSFDYERCMSRADEALYESKRKGRGVYTFWKDIK